MPDGPSTGGGTPEAGPNTGESTPVGSPRQATLDPPGGPARCLRCAYVLRGLKSPGKCPECGRAFDLADAATFTRKPPFVAWKFWLPPLLLSASVSTVMLVVLVFGAGNWGFSVWMVLPFACCSILGYRVRVGYAAAILVAMALGVAFIVGVVSMQLAGVFCALILAGLLIGPILLGLGAGAALRIALKASRFSQRSHLPVLALCALPAVSALIEGPARPGSVETVSTHAVLGAPPQRAWESIVFYEEVEHEPPLLLRIGLAHPLHTIGRSTQPGDVKTCVYNKGHITKRITTAEPGRLLAFEVIDQDIGYERDVRLVGGSFEFQPLPDGTTRVTLRTAYRPLLGPRFSWRWAEHYAVHLLHGHVLEGMRRRAEPDAISHADARSPPAGPPAP